MTKWYCILLLLLLFGRVDGPEAQTPEKPLPDSSVVNGDTASVLKPSMPRIDSLIQHAYSYLGKRYRRGGTTIKGFDCSGYTMTVFRHLRIRLPHTSAGQGLIGVQVSRANISKGDLILFRGRNRRSKRIGHVGIVVSAKNEPVRFIHSSTSEGVRIDRLEFDYYKKRFVKAVRIPDLHR